MVWLRSTFYRSYYLYSKLERPWVHNRHPVRTFQISSSRLGSLKPRPYYVTTPIFYTNAVLHIGHLYTLLVTDIIAQYQRIQPSSCDVHLVTGADEHGLKVQKAAEREGRNPQEFADDLAKSFEKLVADAGVVPTRFLRTSSPDHHKVVQEVWRRLNAKGFIYKDNYDGWYSTVDETYYADAQVMPGALPGTTVAKETGSEVVRCQEPNYIFRLSAFRDSLLEYYSSAETLGIIHPKTYQDEVIRTLSAGPLEDLSISRPIRRVSWGIPVPDDPSQTIYVWFDALCAYLTGTGFPWRGPSPSPTDMRDHLWPPELQVIGKDILRFHAIIFPAMLFALEIPLQKHILVHGHWTAERKKMSKSIGNVVNAFTLLEYVDVEVVRYYFARVGGKFKDDMDWSMVQLSKHSNEIESLLGNFYRRITSNRIQEIISQASPRTVEEVFEATSPEDPNRAVLQLTRAVPETVMNAFERYDLSDAIACIVACLREANVAMTRVAPWSQSPEIAQASYITSVEALRVCGICLQPFMPRTANTLLDALGLQDQARSIRDALIWGKFSNVQGGQRLFKVNDLKSAKD